MKQPNPERDRLMLAAVNTREDLRVLLAKCQTAIEGGADMAGVLRYAREMAGRNADQLTAALKSRARRDVPAFEQNRPLWAVSESRRYQDPRRRAWKEAR